MGMIGLCNAHVIETEGSFKNVNAAELYNKYG